MTGFILALKSLRTNCEEQGLLKDLAKLFYFGRIC